jgi:hypothetical protein
MLTYFASPNNQVQAERVAGKPVLVSMACYAKWMDEFQASFGRILVDSGAYSELNSGTVIDVQKYKDWSQRWFGHADAIAGLDDIRGDYRRGLANLKEIPWSFPTWHDTDPWELIPELVSIARERMTWIAIGLKPPREGKERIVREFCEQIPDDLHVHGWALRRYTHVRRLDSVDSTNWWRDAMKFRVEAAPWLTIPECLDVVMKRYERETRVIADDKQQGLFQ